MRALSEPIARMANQADEAGLLACSVCVDLRPVTTQQVDRRICETPVDPLREQRRAENFGPTGRRVRRDGCLSPLTLVPSSQAAGPEVYAEGLRSTFSLFAQTNTVKPRILGIFGFSEQPSRHCPVRKSG